MERTVWIDIVVNVLIYLPVGFFGSLSIGPRKSVLLAAVLSAAIEILQLFDVSRTCSTLDLISNIGGSALGCYLADVYGKTARRLIEHSPIRASWRPSPALLLLGFWISYLAFPLIPHLRLVPLRMKIELLLHPGSFSMGEAATATFAWLAVAYLLEEIRLSRAALGFLMLLLPARLLIAGRSFTWPEIVGAVCAWVLWSALSAYAKRVHVLAWGGLAVLLVRGLAPFTWQEAATPFSWMPFGGFFEADKNSALTVFFNKSFLYGTVVWLLAQSSHFLITAGLAVVTLLGMIEMLQTHLPGRTPEITDPGYTLILVVVLKLLDNADRRTNAAARRIALQGRASNANLG